MTDEQMEYTDEMRELSGFGGGYEAACRKMALAGARYLIEHVSDELLTRWKLDDLHAESKNEPSRRKQRSTYVAFEKVVGDAEDGCTGAQHAAACYHAWSIRVLGWAAYKAKMTELKNEEG